jgi:hypothetical protein
MRMSAKSPDDIAVFARCFSGKVQNPTKLGGLILIRRSIN